MVVEIIVPSPGESISEVQIAEWLVQDGDLVELDQDICEVDSDKATLSIPTNVAGKIEFLVAAGETVAVGSIIARVDDSVAPQVSANNPKEVKKADVIQDTTSPVQKAPEPIVEKKLVAKDKDQKDQQSNLKLSPLAKKMLEAADANPVEVESFFKQLRASKEDVAFFLEHKDHQASPVNELSRSSERIVMSPLRKKISKRLVAVKNETAMLTTFNEVDMTEVMNLRAKYKEKFAEKHDVRLGFMSFFTKASTIALKEFPKVNSMIDGDEIISYDYCDVGIAVSAPKGLVVPVLRNAEAMSLADIEREIKSLAAKARKGKISLEEMSGGTFTITNGGLFGSMLSTPIINPPQSAILGMHNIVDRPVAINGRVEIRPIMYLALSYDHRVIDGRESVGFLVKVKELLENPERMLLEGRNANEALLGL